ncbi:inner membrane protein [Lelliottia amnigena]|uniref:DUF4153 domain-containing protein n=1 Tax=Lelliottia TaxID=1330545 RepID=UPI0007435275|nr:MULTISPECIES: DUF4153 domain-containing protein [Lelliottia]ATG02817.1 DUF4153 domain-containing protein [Lelliottia amnigena]PEG63874.1 DUF4153 domain-containing protein [Lelliottia amnigena]QXA23114.1 DUF4153 domain-containing protein [Lelliottia amnigena]USR60350.1 DUF4153 domain-containing protein [Lelliottia amnigena]CAI9417774.1 hypothetical protein CCAJJPOJ_03361 [Lelliottia sp. T2.26D-8]
MENSEGLSPATRAGIVLVGAIQGFICYLVTWYIAYADLPADSFWLVCVVPATVVLSTTLALSVTSFKQRTLWLALTVIVLAVAGMGAWLKWTLYGLERWDIRDALIFFSFNLLLMSFLMLPWLQRKLHPASGNDFYTDFHNRSWHNALTLALIFLSNGLFWLVLFLWAELFKLVGIRFFEMLFFDTDWFIAIAIGTVSACAAILARMQLRLIQALQNLLTLIATGLLPLVALLSLLFIAVLPFVGFEAISARTSAAGLLLSLSMLLLILATVVWSPQRVLLPYPFPLRWLIRVALLVAPVYPLLTTWALWLRIGQYGWTPERLYAVLTTLVALVWAVGFCISVINPRRNPLSVQRYVTPTVALLALACLILIHTPILDPWRISVASHMARYHDGRITADQVSLHMLSQTGRKGREALVALQNDPQFTADAKRQRDVNQLLAGQKGKADGLTAAILANVIQRAPGTPPLDNGLWQEMMKYKYRFETCTTENGACLLVSQDLNGDGQPEAVVYQFVDRAILVFTGHGKNWALAGESWKMPEALSRAEFDRALEQGKVGTAVKPWADITIFGERVKVDYDY